RLLRPGQPGPALRSPGQPLRVRRIRLRRRARLGLDARAVTQRELGARVHDSLLGPAPPRAGHEDHAGAGPSTDEAVLGARGAVDEVPLFQETFFALDQKDALAGEHEKVLLVRL